MDDFEDMSLEEEMHGVLLDELFNLRDSVLETADRVGEIYKDEVEGPVFLKGLDGTRLDHINMGWAPNGEVNHLHVLINDAQKTMGLEADGPDVLICMLDDGSLEARGISNNEEGVIWRAELGTLKMAKVSLDIKQDHEGPMIGEVQELSSSADIGKMDIMNMENLFSPARWSQDYDPSPDDLDQDITRDR